MCVGWNINRTSLFVKIRKSGQLSCSCVKAMNCCCDPYLRTLVLSVHKDSVSFHYTAFVTFERQALSCYLFSFVLVFLHRYCIIVSLISFTYYIFLLYVCICTVYWIFMLFLRTVYFMFTLVGQHSLWSDSWYNSIGCYMCITVCDKYALELVLELELNRF